MKVKEGKKKPHRCSSGFYIRIGAVSQKMNTEEIRDFMEDEERIKFDRVKCKEFDYKKHFDRKKLFSFLDRAKITYERKNVNILIGKFKSC